MKCRLTPDFLHGAAVIGDAWRSDRRETNHDARAQSGVARSGSWRPGIRRKPRKPSCKASYPNYRSVGRPTEQHNGQDARCPWSWHKRVGGDQHDNC